MDTKLGITRKYHNKKIYYYDYTGNREEAEKIADQIKKMYSPKEIELVHHTCRGYRNARQPTFLKCVNWVNLIDLFPKSYTIVRLPEKLPSHVGAYMAIEFYSKFGMFPALVETKDDELIRIVDTNYEYKRSNSKRLEEDETRFNRAEYHSGDVEIVDRQHVVTNKKFKVV